MISNKWVSVKDRLPDVDCTSYIVASWSHDKETYHIEEAWMDGGEFHNCMGVNNSK